MLLIYFFLTFPTSVQEWLNQCMTRITSWKYRCEYMCYKLWIKVNCNLPGSLSNGFLKCAFPKCMPKGMACSGSVWHLQKWQVPFCCQTIAVQVSSNKHCNACSTLLMPHLDSKHVKCSGKSDCGYSKMSPHTPLINIMVIANIPSITADNVTVRLYFPLDAETATEISMKFYMIIVSSRDRQITTVLLGTTKITNPKHIHKWYTKKLPKIANWR